MRNNRRRITKENKPKDGLIGYFFGIIKKTINDGKNQSSKSRSSGFSKQVDVVRKHKPDYFIFLSMAILMMLGLMLIYAIGPQRAQLLNKDYGPGFYSANHFFFKQLVSIVLALIAFIFCSHFPLKMFKKYSLLILLISFGMAILLFIFSKSPEAIKSKTAICALGACRWLRFGPISLQVSEMMKISWIIFLSVLWGYFTKKDDFNSKDNLIVSVPIILFGLFIIAVLQKDLGTALSFLAIIIMMAWVAKISFKNVLISGIFLIVAVIIAVITQPHRISRMAAFFGGNSSSNYHAEQAKIALGTGGLFGLGVGNSIQSTGYLPEAINDSIFPIIGEMFGLFGTLFVILMFVFLIYRLLINLILSHNYYYKMLIAGALGWIFAHFLFNIYSMIGLAPITGITLPFLSYGGTSMIFITSALGLAFNASRYTAHSVNLKTKRRRKR